jgi:hypothetical protein
MDLQKFKQTYIKTISESANDADLKNYIRSIVEEVLSEQLPWQKNRATRVRDALAKHAEYVETNQSLFDDRLKERHLLNRIMFKKNIKDTAGVLVSYNKDSKTYKINMVDNDKVEEQGEVATIKAALAIIHPLFNSLVGK